MNKKRMTHRQRATTIFMPIWTVLVIALAAFMVTIEPLQP